MVATTTMHLRVLRFSGISRDFQLRSVMYQLFESLSCGYNPRFSPELWLEMAGNGIPIYQWCQVPRHPSAPVLATVDPYVDTCATDGCRGCPNWERRPTIGSMDWLIFKKKCFKAWFLPPNTGCSCRYFPQKHNFGKGRWSE